MFFRNYTDDIVKEIVPTVASRTIKRTINVQRKHPANHLMSSVYNIDITKETPTIASTRYLASLKSEKYYCRTEISYLSKVKSISTAGTHKLTTVVVAYGFNKLQSDTFKLV